MVYLMGLVIRNLEGKFRVYKNKKASTIIRLSMLFTSRGDWIRTSDHTPPPGADFKSLHFSISLIFRTYTTEHQMLIFY